MNKPLSSFILLSLQVRILRLPPAARHPLLPACLLPGCAGDVFTPPLRKPLAPGDAQLRWGISFHLCAAQDTARPVQWAQPPRLPGPITLQEPRPELWACGEKELPEGLCAARLTQGTWTTFYTDRGNEDLARP